MREQSEYLMRPYINITPYVVRGTPIVAIRISNNGRFPASNLRLCIDKNFYKFGDNNPKNNIAKFKAFNEPISMFAPGAELNFDLAMGFRLFDENADRHIMPTLFTITATNEFFGRKVTEENTIDLAPFLGVTLPRDLIAKELSKVSDAIKELSCPQTGTWEPAEGAE